MIKYMSEREKIRKVASFYDSYRCFSAYREYVFKMQSIKKCS